MSKSEQPTKAGRPYNRLGFILVLLIGIGISVNCLSSSLIQVVTPTPVSGPTVEPSPDPTPTQTQIPQSQSLTLPTQTPGTYTVAVNLVYIRDRDLVVVGHLDYGAQVSCIPSIAGWCRMEDGNVVWQGCLSDPGPYQCETK